MNPRRPVSVGHLVIGLVFAGIAGLWLLGRLTPIDLPAAPVAGPFVLIGAGLIGLVASVANSRGRRVPGRAGGYPDPDPYDDRDPYDEPAGQSAADHTEETS